MENKIFIFDRAGVFFKHTDFNGFLHPYNYFEWTSYARESYFQETVPNFEDVLNRPIKMMTTKIELSLFVNATFGDVFDARLTVSKIKKVSFDMIVRFYNRRKELVSAETRHSIVFIDTERSTFAPIPEEMLRVITNYQEGGS
ncbi:MAG TPA: hypothetical protein DIW23_06700 [Anaerolineae bacterium]|nr:hypothetical protein [Anaerolineae bacterium]